MRRITKAEFYSRGGFTNPRLIRKMISNRWFYYEVN